VFQIPLFVVIDVQAEDSSMSVVRAPFRVTFEPGPDSTSKGSVTDKDRQRRELLEDNRRLLDDNARLADENRALREAAAIWIGLYERQLERANSAVADRSLTKVRITLR
jgi:hypothetical protein